MATSARIEVTDDATLIAGRVSGTTDDSDGSSSTVGGAGQYVITNKGNATLDLGGPTVASGDGFELPDDTTMSFDLGPGDSLWAVGPGAGPYEVQVLRIDG